MSHDEIMAMAREAGMNLTPAQFSGVLEDEVDEFKLERFAALVAAKEREACAQVAMEFRRGAGDPVCGEVATAIRERNSHVS